MFHLDHNSFETIWIKYKGENEKPILMLSMLGKKFQQKTAWNISYFPQKKISADNILK